MSNEPTEMDRYKSSSLRTYNEKLPHRYDTSIAVRFYRPSRMDDFVLDALGEDVKTCAILDVGCATGRLLERMAEAGGRTLAGSDLAPRIVDVARAKLSRFAVDVDFKSGDAETSLPWPAGTFDVVTLTGVMHHFYRPESALREIRRVLRTHGRLVVADACFFPPVRQFFNLCLRIHPHEGDCYFYTIRQLREMLARCGWRINRCGRINWWAFGLVAHAVQSDGAPAD